ncbi:hypothetical protein A9Q84_11135 [Halobacteriovorax marinus]|uniref:Uncharacterized protein n=1 Tax=Halobacteriovorax marinus TaxID=97084 RepID=A0A1Y5F7M8_9BACT|nr:hypothetical protein A9Q84_11135 [Halobacteriovorax marinus]
MKTLLQIVLAIFLLNKLANAGSIDLSQNFSGVNLGQGVQLPAHSLTPFSCVEVDESMVEAGSNFLVKSDYLEIETLEEIKSLTKGGLQISELFKGKLEKSLSSTTKDKVIKMSLSFLQKQQGKSSVKLKPNFEFLARNGLFVEFAHACGTNYLASIAKGHKLHIFMIVSSTKEQSKKEFEAVLKLKLNELISKLSGTETVEQVLGKLELTASLMKKMESLNQKIQLEYTIAMTSASDSASLGRLVMPSEAPIATGISNQISETGNNLTQLLLTLTKSFPQFALGEFKNNLQNLPVVAGESATYVNLLATSFMGEELFELEADKLQKFLQSNQDFHFFVSAFEKLADRKDKISMLLAKAKKVQNTTTLKFKRKKKLAEILKLLQINMQSTENIHKYCDSTSLVYADCYALAFGKAPGEKQVKQPFIQAGNDFTCLESNDIPSIETCLDQGMGPSSCKRISFSVFNLDLNRCEKSQTDFLADFMIPLQPKVL